MAILQIVATEDGSITCLDEATGELYHNRAGAYTESLLNYVEPLNLSALIDRQPSMRVLDVCFGLGYNTFVLLDQLVAIIDLEHKTAKFSIDILGLDIDTEILTLVPEVLKDSRFKRLSAQISNTTGIGLGTAGGVFQSFGCYNFHLGVQNNIDLTLEIRCADVRQEAPKLAHTKTHSFDFIFHDGFSPRRMPELWTVDLFELYVQLLKPTGKILTYSSATAVRGAFRDLGLVVNRTSAVGGKSGGTIAGFDDDTWQTTKCFALSEAEKARLQSRSATPYSDPTLSATRIQILQSRVNKLLHFSH